MAVPAISWGLNTGCQDWSQELMVPSLSGAVNRNGDKRPTILVDHFGTLDGGVGHFGRKNTGRYRVHFATA